VQKQSFEQRRESEGRDGVHDPRARAALHQQAARVGRRSKWN
jgi:hypothetical protein